MVALLKGLILPLQVFNDITGTIGRWISVCLIGLMVITILTQVFFRYVLNNALPWPDEAARFFMLWMTGFMAPIAFRRGGFVSIDIVVQALPKRAGAVLSLLLLLISLMILVIAVPLGWDEITGFGGRFNTASLYIPLSLSFDEWFRIPKSWMFASLFVGVVGMLIVNIELILRTLVTILGAEDELRPIPGETVGAE